MQRGRFSHLWRSCAERRGGAGLLFAGGRTDREAGLGGTRGLPLPRVGAGTTRSARSSAGTVGAAVWSEVSQRGLPQDGCRGPGAARRLVALWGLVLLGFRVGLVCVARS